MTTHDIISVQLESLFGSMFPQSIQRLVDEELNQGRWVDGYDLAVCQDIIEAGVARELLEIVLSQHPSLRINEAALRKEVEIHLPQSRCGWVTWIIDENGSFALTDGLRVARFEGESIVWRSSRISLDGIEFDTVADGKLHGRAWFGSEGDPDFPFIFDFQTGRLLEGHVVAHD